MKNKYAKPCTQCRKVVESGSGLTFRGVGGAWSVRCSPPCKPPTLEATAKVTLSASDERRVRFTPFLGELAVRAAPAVKPSLFAQFRAICARAGTRSDYEDGRPVDVIPVTGASALIKSLSETGFVVELTAEVEVALRAVARESRRLAEWLDIDKMRAELTSRNKKFWGQFQEDGVQFLAERQAALLADPPGTGKTFQTIMAVPPGSGLVVIAPASVVGMWFDQIRNLKRLTPTRLGRAWPEPGFCAVTSYAKIPDSLPGKIGPHAVLVADEGHRLKSKSSKRTKRFRQLSKAVIAAGGRGYILTGTPLENREIELWEVLESLGISSRVFGTRKQFLALIERDRESFITALKSVMLRRRKEDVLPDLPAKIRSDVHVRIGQEDRRELDGLLQQIREVAAKQKVEAYRKECLALGVDPDAEKTNQIHTKALADVNAAIDATFNGELDIPFGLLARVKSILATAKLVRSLALVAELEPDGADKFGVFEQPILFFSCHLGPARAAAKRRDWALLDGSSSQEERTQLAEDFQNGKYRGLAITLAGGEGINLYKASTIVVNDCDWKPSSMNQVEARCHRIGQLSSVQVFRVVTDHPLDARILQLLTYKQEIFDGTVTRAEGHASKASGLAGLLESAITETRVKPTTQLKVEGARKPNSVPEQWAEIILERHAQELKAGDLTRATARSAVWAKDYTQGLTDQAWTMLVSWARANTREGDPSIYSQPQEKEIVA